MTRKALAALFPALSAAALCLWLRDSFLPPMGNLFADRAGTLLALARLAGLLGALGLMWQLLFMSRADWLAPLRGPSPPLRHHRLGLFIPLLLLAHPALMLAHYSLQSGASFRRQLAVMLGWSGIPAALLGAAVIIAVVLISPAPLQRRIPYPVWRRVHLAVYAGLALAVAHQFSQGGDLSAGKYYFQAVWAALLVFTAAASSWYRLLKPAFGQKAPQEPGTPPQG